MLIERVLESVHCRSHRRTALQLAQFVAACMGRMELPPPSELGLETLQEVMYLLLSLRAARPERFLELEGAGQHVAVRTLREPSVAPGSEELGVPELVPVADGSARLAFYVEPAYASSSDLRQRLELLVHELPLVVEVRTEAPQDSLPLLLRPLSELEVALGALGMRFDPGQRGSLDSDLRQWQREEAFRSFTLTGEGGAVVLSGGSPPELASMAREGLRLGVLLAEPFTHRSGWEEVAAPEFVPRRHLLWQSPLAPATTTLREER